MTSFSPSYEVFISYRGKDTRKGFTSHLYDALCRKGVKVFIDNNLKRGLEIHDELVKAIEESSLSVIVFSKHYAFSTWCLDEVVTIMQCKELKGQMVRPVFVDVDPSQVRGQTGSFAQALSRHERNYKNHGKVQKWRAALKEAANLSGWHLQNQTECEIIQRIVEEVYNKLNCPVLHVAEHPVGLDSQVQTVNSLLNIASNDVSMLAIYGVGGIGKTTIARAVYNMVADGFQGSSFLVSVGEMSKKHGMFWLQETLLCEVTGEKSLKIVHSHIGRDLIKAKLRDKKVLVVLDGVDHFDQINNLAGGKDWFGLGSRVIITTRAALLLDRVDVVYQTKELEQVDALQLFSWKAFKKPHPPSDQYKLLSNHFISLAKGIPLAIILLGSFLNSKTIEEWTSAHKKLVDKPFESINQIVQMSFDGLGINEESIFLDIACFFQGHHKDFVIKQFDRCNFHPEEGIRILLDLSLIYIEFDKVWMHEIIQQFGKDIVLQESPLDPGRRSRLWYRHDILQVLNQDSVNYVTEGMKLDWPGAEDEFGRSNAIGKFKGLRILMVHDACISGCPGYLSKDLKWLNAHDLSSPRAIEIHHDAYHSRCSVYSFKDVKRFNQHNLFSPKTLGTYSAEGFTVIFNQKGTTMDSRILVDDNSITKRRPGCFLEDLNLNHPAFASRNAAGKIVQLFAGSVGSLIESVNKHCFVKPRQNRKEDNFLWQFVNDMKIGRDFSFYQIRQSIGNFMANMLVGSGCSNSVYSAKFESGSLEGVKKTFEKGSQHMEFMLNELENQRGLHHKNSLLLVCYSAKHKELILMMELLEKLGFCIIFTREGNLRIFCRTP